jgi:hypothetical protein
VRREERNTARLRAIPLCSTAGRLAFPPAAQLFTAVLEKKKNISNTEQSKLFLLQFASKYNSTIHNCKYDSQVSVRNQDKSFPKSHLELTFWFCLVHVMNHSRRRDVKVMRHFGTSQPQRN